MHRPLYLFLGPIVAQLVLLQACKNGHGLTGSLSPGTISTASTASPIASVGDRRPDNAPVPDAKLASAIEGAMGRDPVLGPSSIHVSVTHGEVTLAGNVPTLAARWRAGRLVEAFKGATSLSNGIRVQASPQPDAETAKAVKDAIGRDPALRSAKVTVTSRAGTVVLRGTVDSYAQRELLARTASRVRGVQDVNVDVVSLLPTPRDDAQVVAEAKDRLENDARLDGTRVDVVVRGSATAISGAVGSLAQRNAAIEDASVAGTGMVDAHALLVDWRESEKTRSTTPQPASSDAHIAAAVEHRLASDVRVGLPVPSVLVAQGVVTLAGTLMDFRATKAAVRDARGTSGVWRVEDRMVVPAATRESDRTIQAQVLQAIYNDGTTALDARNVRVTTTNARVTLEGAAASAQERSMIEDDVDEVPGVVAVDDHLQVQGYGADTHRMLSGSIWHDVVEKIFWDPRVEGGNVNAEVAANGDVTLSGLVYAGGEARAASEDATLAGAAHVISHIRIAGASGG